MVKITEVKQLSGKKAYLMRDEDLNFYLGDTSNYRRINDFKADSLCMKATGIRNIVKLRTYLTQHNMEGEKYGAS